MLDEHRALALSYDAATDVAKVTFAHERLGTEAAAGTRATLLVDARGFLVGVDVHARTIRAVVMLGAHEDVARSIETTVDVAVSGDRCELRIANGRSVRANEANPYG